jgi:hypothetical protein
MLMRVPSERAVRLPSLSRRRAPTQPVTAVSRVPSPAKTTAPSPSGPCGPRLGLTESFSLRQGGNRIARRSQPGISFLGIATAKALKLAAGSPRLRFA